MISPFNVRVRPDPDEDGSVADRTGGKEHRRPRLPLLDAKDSTITGGSSGEIPMPALTGAAKDGDDGSDDDILDREDLKKVSQSIIHTNERKQRAARKPKA